MYQWGSQTLRRSHWRSLIFGSMESICHIWTNPQRPPQDSENIQLSLCSKCSSCIESIIFLYHHLIENYFKFEITLEVLKGLLISLLWKIIFNHCKQLSTVSNYILIDWGLIFVLLSCHLAILICCVASVKKSLWTAEADSEWETEKWRQPLVNIIVQGCGLSNSWRHACTLTHTHMHVHTVSGMQGKLPNTPLEPEKQRCREGRGVYNSFVSNSEVLWRGEQWPEGLGELSTTSDLRLFP